MISLQAISLLNLLPENIRSDGTVFAAAQAIDTELQALTGLVYQLSHFDRMDQLSESETDELAWQYHVDYYDPSLPIAQRRELVKNSYRWHKHKGTPSAVEELITTVFGSGQVREWFEYGGDPFHFKVVTSDDAATTTKAQQFIDAIASAQNARSWLESIEINKEAEMALYYGGLVHIGDYMSIEQAV